MKQNFLHFDKDLGIIFALSSFEWTAGNNGHTNVWVAVDKAMICLQIALKVKKRNFQIFSSTPQTLAAMSSSEEIAPKIGINDIHKPLFTCLLVFCSCMCLFYIVLSWCCHFQKIIQLCFHQKPN